MKQTGWTTISQGSKLVELGLDPETADMTWVNDLDGDHIIAKPYQVLHKELDELRATCGEIESVESPAWSLAILLDLLPYIIDVEGWCYDIGIYRNEKLYFMDYRNVNNGNQICEFKGESFVDVAVDTICFLLENNFIKKGNHHGKDDTE